MKKILASLFFVTCSLFGFTLDEFNQVIEKQEIQWVKQTLICEREANINPANGNVNECIKAAGMVLALKSKKLNDHEKSLIDAMDASGNLERLAASYFLNASAIYGAHGDKKNEVKMLEKAAKQKKIIAIFKLGVAYYNGEGVVKNHIKSYEYFKEALKLGDTDAQNSIEIICRESPWACK